MRTCSFCETPFDETNTFCRVCGYPLVKLLPFPTLMRKRLYYGLSGLSIILGILACAFTFVPSLYMRSLIPIIGSLGLAGFTLEKVRGRLNALPIKILAVVGLVIGVLGYTFFMLIHSNVPGCKF